MCLVTVFKIFLISLFKCKYIVTWWCGVNFDPDMECSEIKDCEILWGFVCILLSLLNNYIEN